MNNLKDVACPNCNFTSTKPSALTKHFKSYYMCEKCKESFCGHRASRKFQAHQRTCSKPKQKKIYGCCVCSKQFEFKSYCERHINTSKCANSYCEVPDKMFVQFKPISNDSNSNLEPETGQNWSNNEEIEFEKFCMVQKGQQLSQFKCFMCNEKCNSVSDLHVHIDSAHCEILPTNTETSQTSKENHVCKTCGVDFNRVRTVTCHMNNTHNEVKTHVMNCSICQAEFSTKHNHRVHMKEAHDIVVQSCGKKKHFCHLCGKSCPSSAKLIEHVSSVHEKIRNFKCSTCGKSFSALSSLKKHQKYIHDGVKEVCETCGKIYGDMNSLKYHIKRFHEKQKIEKNHVCETCGKAFVNSFVLTEHVNYHHKGLQNYKCDQCGKAFVSQAYIKQHILTVHQGIKKFECEQCGKFFSTKTILKDHVAMVHEKQRNYKCELCNKAFSSPYYLQHHVAAVHEGLRKFNCEFCGTTFAHKEGMLCHIRSVHEGIRYQCDFCAKSFTQKPHLKSHLREAHNQ